MKRSTSLTRRIIAPLALLLVTLSAGNPAMARYTGNSVEIRVTGSLVPPACTLSLPAGNEVDYGRILFSELSGSEHTLLPEREIAFAINCDTPAKMAMLMTDQKSSSVVPDLIKAVRTEPHADQFANGLGSINGTNIGIYYVRVSVGSGINRPGSLRPLRSNHTQGWAEISTDAPLYANGLMAIGFSDNQTTAPSPISSLTGVLKIQPIIRPRKDMPTSDEIAMEGSSTLTLYYQ